MKYTEIELQVKYTDDELKEMSSEDILKLRKDIVFGNRFRALINDGMEDMKARYNDHDLMDQINKLEL